MVNCAVNLDFNYVRQADLVSDHEGSAYGPGEMRYYKIGLIDGAGNPDTQMIAAYYILRARWSRYCQTSRLIRGGTGATSSSIAGEDGRVR